MEQKKQAHERENFFQVASHGGASRLNNNKRKVNMGMDTVHKVLIKVFADEGIECELDERGRCWVLGTIAKPGASEEERRDASRKSWTATKIPSDDARGEWSYATRTSHRACAEMCLAKAKRKGRYTTVPLKAEPKTRKEVLV